MSCRSHLAFKLIYLKTLSAAVQCRTNKAKGKSKAIPVSGGEGLQDYETSRIPSFLCNRKFGGEKPMTSSGYGSSTQFEARHLLRTQKMHKNHARGWFHAKTWSWGLLKTKHDFYPLERDIRWHNIVKTWEFHKEWGTSRLLRRIIGRPWRVPFLSVTIVTSKAGPAPDV
jgi:hypothetical protein